MNNIKPTATAVANMRRRAKRITRAGELGYSEALEQEAEAAGFANWHALIASVLEKTVLAVTDLPVDPKLPKHFYNRANGDRSAAELRKWWNKPFACTSESGGLDIRCLDGGAWDRPTFYGVATNSEDASALAAKKLGEWLKHEKELICTLTGHSIQWVQYPHDPRKRPVVLAEFADGNMDEAKKWKEQWLKDRETVNSQKSGG